MRTLQTLRPVLCLIVAGAFTAACSGGPHTSSPSVPVVAAGVPAVTATRLVAAKFAFRIPVRSAKPAAAKRKPLYLAASTASLKLTLTASSNTAFSGPQSTTMNVSPGASGTNYTCTAVSTGSYTCTTTLPMPAGTDTMTLAAYDATNAAGTVLSQQVVTETVVLAGVNAFAVTLDATPGSSTVTAPASGVSGNVATGFTFSGLTAGVFTVQGLDADGTPFNGQAGIPLLKAFSSSTAVATVTLDGPPATQLTVSPQAPGTTTIGLYSIAPHGAGSTIFTATTSAIAAGAASLGVASSTGITAGMTLLLDSGTTQESVQVAGVSGTTVSLGGVTAHAHARAVPLADLGNNGLLYGAVTFTVTISPQAGSTPAPTDFTSETFSGVSSAADSWQFGAHACLTAGSSATAASSVIPCNATASDSVGSGTLQLTDGGGTESGFAISKTAIITNGGTGITIAFDYFCYHGSGADGLSVFLIDASQGLPTSPGSSGGGLGYEGIAGGYLGIGLDTYGNFGNVRTSEAVSVRGATSNGHPFIGGSGGLAANTFDSTSTTRPAAVHIVTTITYPHSLSVSINGTTRLSLTSFGSTQPAFPAQVFVGFAASSGGSTDFHEIRNVTITANP